MFNVHDFISFAKTVVGLWHYLFGSVRVQTTQDTLDRYYEEHYGPSGMTRARYDALTATWKPTDYATDCQGLLDAWLTYEAGEKTDINADYNYRYWCEEKGRLEDVDRPYCIGEALFMQSKSSDRMTHVGWVCGFGDDGDPLVVEARGIAYGVVITKLSKRPWTHRGLMTKKFSYEEKPMEKIRFERTTPMHKGEPYLKMQQALNAAGYTDADGKKLDEDGKWGKCSQAAFDALIADYSEQVPQLLEFAAEAADGGYMLKATVAKLK